ncbi:DNA-(apurinic or apyrimidinic site) lyase [Mycena indigotica]|uniref:DNA-(Apurinic or apyrimidinic site) lyase n=1 Tax=Mycena indigotica TaxID=2126181 RepID=A0A8H6VUV8_9AGAR|nr:DNA-(apurinic or apyrimidinic site) lyase [Mycena indigotica]KAF7294794.1 DNA-(apurinic or apyrimidinic site) lyase [Mycena indigotica]
MPPRRAASSKRKAEASDSEAEEKITKKAKTEAVTTATGPTNTVLPDVIEFPPRISGTLRLATWNVCGIAASQKKGFKRYVEAEDPDILVLTETKVNNEPVDLALKARFPHWYWSISSKKTYSGTAILSKIKPLSVTTTLPGHPDPDLVKGRIITLEFENSYVVGTYVVNAGQDLKTLEQKKEWNVHFTTYIRDLDKRKPVIWTGDLNVAPTDLDLSNGKKNWNKSPGYTEAETTAFKNILEPPSEVADSNKFVDVWRQRHPDERQYTYFSYRFNCRLKGLGWRLDMFVLSERIADRVKMVWYPLLWLHSLSIFQCEIRSEIYGASDHCPLVMEIEGAL